MLANYNSQHLSVLVEQCSTLWYNNWLELACSLDPAQILKIETIINSTSIQISESVTNSQTLFMKTVSHSMVIIISLFTEFVLGL